jgi:hypothetical protein
MRSTACSMNKAFAAPVRLAYTLASVKLIGTTIGRGLR